MNKKSFDFLINTKQLIYEGTYWKYLNPEFETYLKQYLQKFEVFRNNRFSKSDWEKLPFGDKAQNESWALRRSSLKIISKEIKKTRPEMALEIGAWNGWLSKYIAPECSLLIASDYFVHPFDGIGSIEQLHPNICALQTDLALISSNFKQNSFDLIVLNHVLPFVINPTEYLLNLIPLLKKNGKILAIGNVISKNPQKIIEQNELECSNFKNKFDMNLYLHPLKGYFEYSDLQILQSNGFRIKKYKSKFLRNLYAMINSEAPMYFYIEYENA